ncbi:DUF4406 domain-containing protein [Sphingobacterium shayense]|uniref:DUF4406 domain-containing protein n=1 Tax=Sphingobacterium shayense TaxID=626343 RepID=UPI001552347E|nr:DUF4406 domain-containing protein [Sphingobacterium shayense]NQD71652.1 DUF4406 domain-containing protein [Sphingobacterium shayense]
MSAPIVYIAGPISGQPDLNRPAFYAADEILKHKGFITRNPHEFCSDIVSANESDPRYYRRGIEVLTKECTDIILLDNWAHSAGAAEERRVAILCGIRVHHSVEDIVEYFTSDEEA